MNRLHFSQDQLIQVAKLSDADMIVISERRSPQTKLGLGYQLAFVRLFNQFPPQVSFEPLDDIVTYMSLQLDIIPELIEQYKKRRETIAEHRQRIQEYLHLQPFHPEGVRLLDEFLYKEALQIEPTDSLLIKATHFLRGNHILNPAEDTLRRTIYEQRKKARTYIFESINAQLSLALKEKLDSLLQTGDQTVSAFHQIKEAPQKPSEAGMKLLSAKLAMIEQTGALTINLDWLNNNYKRHLSSYAINCDAHKLRELTPMHRYASLICFLQDAYQDVIDYIFDMYAKALTSVHSQAETTVDNYNKEKRNVIRSCLTHYKKLCSEVLAMADGTIDMQAVLRKFPSAELQAKIAEVEVLLSGKYSNSLNIVADRFSYLRKLAKPLFEKLTFDVSDTGSESLLGAMQLAWLLMKKVTNWDYRTIASMAGVSHPTLIRANDFFLRKKIYEKVFVSLVKQAYKKGLIQGKYVAMDSSFIHTFSSKGELGSEGWNEFKEGYGFKLHLLIDCETKFPIALIITNGLANDMTLAIPLLKKARYWLRKTKYVLADKGYDWEDIVNWIVKKIHAKAGIPIKRIGKRGKNYSWEGAWRNFQYKSKGRTLKKSIYNRRGSIERVFSVLKRTYHLGKEETRGILNFAKNVYLTLICYMLKLFWVQRLAIESFVPDSTRPSINTLLLREFNEGESRIISEAKMNNSCSISKILASSAPNEDLFELTIQIFSSLMRLYGT